MNGNDSILGFLLGASEETPSEKEDPEEWAELEETLFERLLASLGRHVAQPGCMAVHRLLDGGLSGALPEYVKEHAASCDLCLLRLVRALPGPEPGLLEGLAEDLEPILARRIAEISRAMDREAAATSPVADDLPPGAGVGGMDAARMVFVLAISTWLSRRSSTPLPRLATYRFITRKKSDETHRNLEAPACLLLLPPDARPGELPQVEILLRASSGTGLDFLVLDQEGGKQQDQPRATPLTEALQALAAASRLVLQAASREEKWRRALLEQPLIRPPYLLYLAGPDARRGLALGFGAGDLPAGDEDALGSDLARIAETAPHGYRAMEKVVLGCQWFWTGRARLRFPQPVRNLLKCNRGQV